MIIAYVGAGGKTTALHEDAKRFYGKGKRVLICTTTHMKKEKKTIITDQLFPIQEALLKDRICMAGTECPDEKMGPLPRIVFERACQLADVVLVEADGSRQKPIKACFSYEPVLPDQVGIVKVVMGLSAIGQKIEDCAYHVEKVCSLLEKEPEEIVDPSDLLSLAQKAYVIPLKVKFPNAQFQILYGQADTLYKKAIKKLLEEEKDPAVLDPSWFDSKQELVILGAGHVAKEIAFLACRLDFFVTVFDDRKDFVSCERFPYAEHRICDSFSHLDQVLKKNAYYVVVTRGHENDLDCVDKILSTSYSYIGMIGSQKKVGYVKEQLVKRGHSKQAVSMLHAPIGYPIGAITPAEIAISILAEIISVYRSKERGSASYKLLNSQQSGTLCILTRKTGSSPRAKGAMMLVTQEQVIDTIGGGILEKKVIDLARQATSVFERTFDFDSKESAKQGMVCGGSNTILFIPLS